MKLFEFGPTRSIRVRWTLQELARSDFLPMAQVLEDHMRDREFLVGDSVTVGDFVLGYTLDWAKLVNLLDGMPRLDSYVERMYARPNAPMRIAEAFARIRASAAH